MNNSERNLKIEAKSTYVFEFLSIPEHKEVLQVFNEISHSVGDGTT